MAGEQGRAGQGIGRTTGGARRHGRHAAPPDEAGLVEVMLEVEDELAAEAAAEAEIAARERAAEEG